MSGKLRQRIPTLNSALMGYLNQYEKDLNSGEYEFDKENKQICEKAYLKTRRDIKKIETTYDKLRQINIDLKKLLKSLKTEDRGNEEKIISTFKEKHNFTNTLAMTDEILDALKEVNMESKRAMKKFGNETDSTEETEETDTEKSSVTQNSSKTKNISLLDNEMEESEFKSTLSTLNNEPKSNKNQKISEIKPRRIKIKLPAQSLIHFNGKYSEWQTFWDDFESSVHNDEELENIQKFKYLKGLVHNEPYRIIAPYPLTNTNYDIVIGLLQKRYGNPDLLRESLHTELRNLKKINDYPSDLRKSLLYINRIILQLKNFDENIDHPQIRQTIETKLPPKLRIKIHKYRHEDEQFSTSEILEYLDTYTQAREEVENVEQSKDLNNNIKFKNKPRYNQNTIKGRYNQNIQPKRFNYNFESRNKPNQFYQNQNNTHNRFSSNPHWNTTAMVANINPPKQNNISNQFKNKSKETPWKKTTFCYFCQKDTHLTADCKIYTEPQKRYNRCVELNICKNCLRKDHNATNCRSKFTCQNCHNKHHTLLCRKKNIQSTKINLIQITSPSDESRNPNENVHEDSSNNEGCIDSTTFANKFVNYTLEEELNELFMTVEAPVCNLKTNITKTVSILLDTASQKSYITSELAHKLSLPIIDEKLLAIETFNNKNRTIINSQRVKAGIQVEHGNAVEINLQTFDKITNLHKFNKNENWYKSILNIEKSQPDLLIGIDYYWDFMIPECRIKVLPSGFHMIETRFGIIVSGKGKAKLTKNNLTQIKHKENDELNKLVQRFWDLENLGIVDSPYVNDNDTAMQHFQQYIKFENKRYYIKWPFKQKEPELPTNFGLTLGRLKSTVRKLKKENLLTKYNDIFEEQLKTGIIEEVDFNGYYLTHYLPHQCVIKESSNTTKLRIVYDASAKTTGNNSLNDTIHQGPTLLPDLLGIILRFRCKKYVLISDLEKAFLQIGLQESERDVTRFLWIKDEIITELQNNPKKELSFHDLKFLRFQRMPFGINASPFLLSATIKHHLSNKELMDKIFTKYYNLSSYIPKDFTDEKSKYLNMIKMLKNNGYVDNFLMFSDDEKDLLLYHFWSKQVFDAASMNLREFISNNQTINKILSERDDTEIPDISKLLGIKWDVTHDILNLNLSMPVIKNESTKRNILQIIAKNFDPMGWISSAILKYKIYFQNMWRDDIKWDDPLANEYITKWNEIAVEKSLQITRYPININDNTGEIHIFGDASALAYGSVVYLKVNDESTLIFSKCRLNPVKSMTIPRLELMSILTSLRILKFLINEINIPISSTHIWSDSQCALSWLKTDKSLPTFIKNRVKEIKTINQEHQSEFHYLQSEQNPADILSRGMDINELEHSELWWKGPTWLKLDKENWPQTNFEHFIIKTENEAEAEILETSVHIASVDNTTDKSIIEWTKFNTWNSVILTIIMVFRFITIMFKKSHKFIDNFRLISALNTTKIDSAHKILAEKYIIRLIQTENAPSNEDKTQLKLWPNKFGILLCHGRLSFSCIDSTDPIYLPRTHHCTNLIILDYHSINNHSGTATTLSEIRKTYWIPKGRRMVDKVRKNCMYCKRYLAQPYALPDMPHIPKSRVQRSLPFEMTGLDYMGPFPLKEPYSKSWILIFTCFVTRGLHLELVTSLSVEQFLSAFRRFLSRKGTPKQIWSDNGSQLKHASKILPNTLILKEIFDDPSLTHYFLRKNIKWNFSVEYAPWQGGCYERLNKCVKDSMKKVIGKKLLDFNSFHTLICETEALINSRPITYIYNDLNSPEILRPIDFLLPHQSICIPPILEEDEDKDPTYKPNFDSYEKTIELWKNTTKLLDKFWLIWKDDYLTSLRERYTYTHNNSKYTNKNTPKINEIVLIKDESPRAMWKLGKVFDLPRSSDGNIRSAIIQLQNNQKIKRPLNLICPLEIPNINSAELETNKIRKTKVKCHTSNNLIKLPLILSIILIITNIKQISGLECPKNKIYNETVHTTFCLQEGFIVKRNPKDKTLCYEILSCSDKHIRSNFHPFCGPKCTCPDWAYSCSFHEPDSDPEFSYYNSFMTTIYLQLYNNRAEICSFEKSDECPIAVNRSLNTILLYDKSTHFVNHINLQHVQVRNENDFKCLGEGNRTIGTPAFCREKHCDKNGTKFCYYDPQEITYLILSNETKIPIKAWGRTFRKVYLSPYKHAHKIMDTTQSSRHNTTNMTNPQQKRNKRETGIIIQCIMGGIEINSINEVDILGICSSTYCITIHTPQIKEIIMLPPKIVISSYSVEIKLIKNESAIDKQTANCNASPYCEMITCRICLDYIKNPQCVEQLHWAIISVVSLSCLYFLSVSLTILKLIIRLLTWIISKLNCCKKKEKKYSYRSKSLKNYVAILLTIIYLFPKIQSCDEITSMTASMNSCSIDKEGNIKCTFDQTTQITIKPESITCLKLEDVKTNTSIKTIEFTINELQLSCEKKSEYFMRNYKINSESSKRCPGAGHCSGNECETLHTDQNNPELSDSVNNSPGYSYCVPSCGGWHCNCFLATDGCLFYRTYIEPADELIYEVMKCVQWPIETSIKIIDKKDEHELQIDGLTPATMIEKENIQVTLTTTTIPITPILDSKFIIHKTNKVALIVDNEQLLPKSIRCSTQADAEAFKCTVPPEACACNGGDTTVNCECTQNPLPEMFSKEENILPINSNGAEISYNDKITAKMKQTTSLQFQLTFKGYKTLTIYDKSICNVTSHGLTGCYACNSGATWKFECQTDFGKVNAKITCPKNTFMIPCDTKNRPDYLQIMWDSDQIDEKCQVECPGGTTETHIKGNLNYISQQTEKRNKTQDKIEETKGWNFDKFVEIITDTFKFFKDIVVKNLYNILVILPMIIIGALIFVFLFPIIYPFLIRCVCTPFNYKSRRGKYKVTKTVRDKPRKDIHIKSKATNNPKNDSLKNKVH